MSSEGSKKFCKIDQLLSGYMNTELDDWSCTFIMLLSLEELDDPFEQATEEYARQVVQIWKPPYLKGIDW